MSILSSNRVHSPGALMLKTRLVDVALNPYSHRAATLLILRT